MALTKACADEVATPNVKPYVSALPRLMCVDTVLALMFVASMSDFERFGRGRGTEAQRTKQARYKALIANGKHVNVTKTAVASELVRDMWIIGRMVQRELA